MCRRILSRSSLPAIARYASKYPVLVEVITSFTFPWNWIEWAREKFGSIHNWHFVVRTHGVSSSGRL
jgi:hypothetical protein